MDTWVWALISPGRTNCPSVDHPASKAGRSSGADVGDAIPPATASAPSGGMTRRWSSWVIEGAWSIKVRMLSLPSAQVGPLGVAEGVDPAALGLQRHAGDLLIDLIGHGVERRGGVDPAQGGMAHAQGLQAKLMSMISTGCPSPRRQVDQPPWASKHRVRPSGSGSSPRCWASGGRWSIAGASRSPFGDLHVKMAGVGQQRAVLHLLKMLPADDVLAAGHRDEQVADRRRADPWASP